jgi:hypothetical protein
VAALAGASWAPAGVIEDANAEMLTATSETATVLAIEAASFLLMANPLLQIEQISPQATFVALGARQLGTNQPFAPLGYIIFTLTFTIECVRKS